MKTENLIAVLSASVLITGAALSSKLATEEQSVARYEKTIKIEKPVISEKPRNFMSVIAEQSSTDYAKGKNDSKTSSAIDKDGIRAADSHYNQGEMNPKGVNSDRTTMAMASTGVYRMGYSIESIKGSYAGTNPAKKANTKIQVAILLDTSNSMDGLIEQAKSRLWNIVNTLTTLKYHGKTPDIEIGLYEYGNDRLSPQSNYIRQVAPLTTDLDLISEKLFSLRTNGGSEYCGAVIADATKQLNWGKDRSDMKLIYIAGNEPFNQGGVNYREAISDALQNDVYVNTIFCGNQEEGIRTFWKDGADAGKGKYFNIDSNRAVLYIATPYDVRISECNAKINETYISYGSKGAEKKRNQELQDSNAQGVSAANYTERAVSKSKAAYKNDSWDLVDKVKEDQDAVAKLKKEELPKELQNKSAAEIKLYVDKKAKEREAIQKEIGELAKKRQAYIDTEAKKSKSQDDLGNAINISVLDFAKTKGYTVEK